MVDKLVIYKAGQLAEVVTAYIRQAWLAVRHAHALADQPSLEYLTFKK